MEAYVDYQYYKDTFKGSIIPEQSFDNLALKASYYIRDITSDRVNPDDIIDEVKDATCAVMEFNYENSDKEGVVAESTGNHSKTYDPEKNPVAKRRYSSASTYLAHTGLLYRGVYS